MVPLGKALRRLLPLLSLVAAPSAFAHRLDEYLQATLVSVAADRVQLRITLQPGVDVAERVLQRIDRDNNQSISAGEADAYAGALRQDLTLRVDGQAMPLTFSYSAFATPAELRRGTGIIQLEYSAKFTTLAAGAHRLQFENRHQRAISVYLFNAVKPASNAIRISRQQRNRNQSSGEIDFTL